MLFRCFQGFLPSLSDPPKSPEPTFCDGINSPVRKASWSDTKVSQESRYATIHTVIIFSNQLNMIFWILGYCFQKKSGQIWSYILFVPQWPSFAFLHSRTCHSVLVKWIQMALQLTTSCKILPSRIKGLSGVSNHRFAFMKHDGWWFLDDFGSVLNDFGTFDQASAPLLLLGP